MNPANIKLMSDAQLIQRTEYLVRRVRKIAECLIWHLQEIQDRKLFIEMKYTDMYECLIKHFKYSETVAYARIAALRIIAEVPAVAEALGSGEINLTNLALTQSFMKKQEKKSGGALTVEQKIQYIECIKDKTTAEVKQMLAVFDPVAALPNDRIQYLDKDHVQLHMTANKRILEKIEYYKSLISYENINPTYEEIFNQALDAAIEKIEKKKGVFVPAVKQAVQRKKSTGKVKAYSGQSKGAIVKDENIHDQKENDLIQTCESEKSPNQQNATHSFVVRNSRYIPRNVKRSVMARSKNQCEHIHNDGTRCSSKFQTQFDHIIAFSKGGHATLDNMQMLCRVHNNHKGSS